MKLLVNHLLTIHRMALAKGLAVTELAGMDLDRTLAVLKDSLVYSKAMGSWDERMIAGDHAEPFARCARVTNTSVSLSSMVKRWKVRLTSCERVANVLQVVDQRVLRGVFQVEGLAETVFSRTA